MLKNYYIPVRNLCTDGDGSLHVVTFNLLGFVQENHYNAVEDKSRGKKNTIVLAIQFAGREWTA